tara:strand:- start:786 stop:1184 length:399 start_codon:yes stop_codon:yes gene_type:complete
MKLSQLKSIVKVAVKEAIQEEIKDILMEAVRSPKQAVYETITQPHQHTQPTPSPLNSVVQTTLPENDKMKLRENMMGVLDSMRPGANGTLSATSADVPMQVTAGMNAQSPNGSLPNGSVSMDQIMGLMNSKA